MRRILGVLLVLVALLGAACGDGGGDAGGGDGTPTDGATTGPAGDECPDLSGEAQVAIEMVNSTFTPGCFTYAPVPVVFTNTDSFAHNFSIPDTPVDIDFEAGGESTISPSVWSTPGEFTFFCKYHGTPEGTGMAGTMTIVEG